MRTILYILRKEFRQIKRNKSILPIIFISPLLQLLILVHATTFEIKNVDLCIVDFDHSELSQQLMHKLSGSPFFKIKSSASSMSEANRQLDKGDADMIIIIPSGFASDIVKEKTAKVQCIPDAINSNFATLAYAYASSVILSFNRQVATEMVQQVTPVPLKTITVKPRFWFNSELNYIWYMFPGIMVILISLIGIFVAGMNLVREKEIGTIEQLNVTPIKKYQFIIGKLLPFLIIGIFELLVATTIGRILYGVPLRGSVWVLLGFTVVYLLVVLGIGMLISTMADTQQQMMFISYFVIIVFILLSGIFTPTESMPVWVQKFNIINPLAYFMKVIRMVMLKGSGFKELIPEFISLFIYAVTMLSLATWRYRKTV